MIGIFFYYVKDTTFSIKYNYVYRVIFLILPCYLFPFSCIKRKKTNLVLTRCVIYSCDDVLKQG